MARSNEKVVLSDDRGTVINASERGFGSTTLPYTLTFFS